MHKADVARILLNIGAVTLNTVTPYKYASGLLSPIYVDCRMISSFPKERKLILDYFVEYIDSFIGRNNVDVVVGSGHSGISLATYISEKIKVRMAYIRAAAKDHGKENVVEGVVKQDDRVLLVCDLFGTEGHVEHSVEVLKNLNTHIACVLSIFDLNLNIVEKYLNETGVKYHTLTDLRALLDAAIVEKKISLVEREEILKWLSNPGEWHNLRKDSIEKDVEQIKRDIAKVLLNIKAVTLKPTAPYKWVSGIFAPIYCDNRLLMSYPNEWKIIIDSMLNIIVHKIGVSNIDVIAGTSTAGISHAAYVAEKLNLPMVYIKSKPEEHGKYTQIEGKIKTNQKVLVIEDLISTGGSSIRCVDAVRKAGGVVDNCLAIFTYEMKKARTAFDGAKCNLITLSNFSTLIMVAADTGYIKPEEQEMALEFSKDPAGWGKKMGFE